MAETVVSTEMLSTTSSSKSSNPDFVSLEFPQFNACTVAAAMLVSKMKCTLANQHGRHSFVHQVSEDVRRRSTEGKKSKSEAPTSSKLVKIGALPACIISHEEYRGMVEWLKHHVEPHSKVKQYMEKISINRAAWIKENPQLSICDILQEHPRLFDIPGMIEIDFEAIFGEVADTLFLKWTSSFAENVMAYALLPAIFPTGRKGKMKSSIDDAIKVFVDVQPIGTNMPKYLEENSSDEPHVLVHGSVNNPHQVFVVSKGRALERPNLLTAIDTCFKVFYVMDIEYPWQCGITWEFFQKVIFGLEDRCKHKKTAPSVISMRAALNA